MGQRIQSRRRGQRRRHADRQLGISDRRLREPIGAAHAHLQAPLLVQHHRHRRDLARRTRGRRDIDQRKTRPVNRLAPQIVEDRAFHHRHRRDRPRRVHRAAAAQADHEVAFFRPRDRRARRLSCACSDRIRPRKTVRPPPPRPPAVPLPAPPSRTPASPTGRSPAGRAGPAAPPLRRPPRPRPTRNASPPAT